MYFSILMECTPESGQCRSVYSVAATENGQAKKCAVKKCKNQKNNMKTYSTGKDIFTTIFSIRCLVSFEQMVVCCADAEFMNVQFR
jgi:hypothetical protein